MVLGECPFCLDPIKNRDNACLQCGHVYHLVCILNWFERLTHPKTCGVCRQAHSGEPTHLYLGGDDEDDDDNASVTSEVTNSSTSSSNAAPRRKRVRCTFWPNCKNGKNCLYVHPKKKCEAFEKRNCMRRDMCFYLHPQCKQGNSCNDPLCHYAHITRRIQPQGGDGEGPSNENAWCPFKTTCRNKDCPKKHPQMCKFDPKCTKDTCTFWHPKRNLQGFKQINKTKKSEEKK